MHTFTLLERNCQGHKLEGATFHTILPACTCICICLLHASRSYLQQKRFSPSVTCTSGNRFASHIIYNIERKSIITSKIHNSKSKNLRRFDLEGLLE